MALNYVVTAQRPTAVSHSLVANFTGPQVRHRRLIALIPYTRALLLASHCIISPFALSQDVNLILARGNRLVINVVRSLPYALAAYHLWCLCSKHSSYSCPCAAGGRGWPAGPARCAALWEDCCPGELQAAHREAGSAVCAH
jgi:hypothetical protein